MSTLDFSAPFAAYEALVRDVDAAFASVSRAHPDCVTCHPGCDDCCYALFDLSLVEAVYLNRAFLEAFPVGKERSAILERAAETDRKLYRVKKDAFKAVKAGQDESAVLAAVGRERSRCPLLGDDGRCLLYQSRPLTCRIYGIPTAIGGKGHTCMQSAFAPGGKYPTLHLEKIHTRLEDLSREMAQAAHTSYREIHALLVPLSMALLTTYDPAYFGHGKKASGGRG